MTTRRRGRARARKLGRPAAERVGWEPETFQTIYRSALASVTDVSELSGISEHVLYSWQAATSNRGPNRAQREKIADALTTLTGTTVKPTDLAKRISKVRFTYL